MFGLKSLFGRHINFPNISQWQSMFSTNGLYYYKKFLIWIINIIKCIEYPCLSPLTYCVYFQINFLYYSYFIIQAIKIKKMFVVISENFKPVYLKYLGKNIFLKLNTRVKCLHQLLIIDS